MVAATYARRLPPSCLCHLSSMGGCGGYDNGRGQRRKGEVGGGGSLQVRGQADRGVQQACLLHLPPSSHGVRQACQIRLAGGAAVCRSAGWEGLSLEEPRYWGAGLLRMGTAGRQAHKAHMLINKRTGELACFSVALL